MTRRQLTPHDWSTAALRAMARGGVAAVSVNAIAGELESTRGSFYWHFKDRDALLRAALELWERDNTTALILETRDIADPRQRLTAVFTAALGHEVISGLESAVVAHADHPAVAPVLHRVTGRRIAYLTELYTDLGMERSTARRQAVTAYATYLGWQELRRTSCDIVPETAATGATAAAALEHLITELTTERRGSIRSSEDPSPTRELRRQATLGRTVPVTSRGQPSW